jgi:hypothetical protein
MEEEGILTCNGVALRNGRRPRHTATPHSPASPPPCPSSPGLRISPPPPSSPSPSLSPHLLVKRLQIDHNLCPLGHSRRLRALHRLDNLKPLLTVYPCLTTIIAHSSSHFNFSSNAYLSRHNITRRKLL